MRNGKWAQWAEVVGTFAVVATLIVLILEVRTNTDAIQRQAQLDRDMRLLEPYLNVPDLPDIFAKIKDHDGAHEPQVRAFADTYNLSNREAVLWVRHLDMIWAGIEADYDYYGPSPSLERQMSALLAYPDQRLYWSSYPGITVPSRPFIRRVRSMLESR